MMTSPLSLLHRRAGIALLAGLWAVAGAWSQAGAAETETGLKEVAELAQVNGEALACQDSVAMRRAKSPILDAARSLLMMPDLFHWLLSGEKSNEYTDATTTQFFNPQQNDWARPLLERFDLPQHLLGPVTAPGTRLGPLRAAVAAEVGVNMQVVLPGTHDTASAVMSVPADRKSTRLNSSHRLTSRMPSSA